MSANRWEGGGLSPEEAERLASKFTPSWESPVEPTAFSGAEPTPEAVAPRATADEVPVEIDAGLAQGAAPTTPETATSVTRASLPPRATPYVDEALPSIVVNDPPPVVKSRHQRAAVEAPVAPAPVVSNSGFSKGLYLGLGIGAALVVAVLVLVKPDGDAGSKTPSPQTAITTQSPAPAPTPVDQAPTQAPAHAQAPAEPTATATATAAPPATAAAVLPASAPAPKEPPSSDTSEPSAPASKPAPAPTPKPKASPAPKTPKPSAPAPKPTATAKTRNAPSAGAIVRDAPF